MVFRFVSMGSVMATIIRTEHKTETAKLPTKTAFPRAKDQRARRRCVNTADARRRRKSKKNCPNWNVLKIALSPALISPTRTKSPLIYQKWIFFSGKRFSKSFPTRMNRIRTVDWVTKFRPYVALESVYRRWVNRSKKPRRQPWLLKRRGREAFCPCRKWPSRNDCHQ